MKKMSVRATSKDRASRGNKGPKEGDRSGDDKGDGSLRATIGRVK